MKLRLSIKLNPIKPHWCHMTAFPAKWFRLCKIPFYRWEFKEKFEAKFDLRANIKKILLNKFECWKTINLSDSNNIISNHNFTNKLRLKIKSEYIYFLLSVGDHNSIWMHQFLISDREKKKKTEFLLRCQFFADQKLYLQHFHWQFSK